MNLRDRVARVARDHGVEAAEQGSVVWALAFRVVEAGDLLESAAQRLMHKVARTSVEALRGEIPMAVSGMPLAVVSEEAAAYNAALMRLAERREALRMAVEAATAVRSSN